MFTPIEAIAYSIGILMVVIGGVMGIVSLYAFVRIIIGLWIEEDDEE